MGDTDKFEHFVITRRPDGSLWELGRGAMGVTYKAFDTNLRADVALKVINSHYLNSETARQRFLREARAAASLRHPNVATVFHLGNAEGEFYYAMEYVEGETVERRVQREGPLPSELALRIARQVSRALIAADRQKLIHRDIKPSNIMLVVDEDEDHLLVKVIDFGLAKSLVAAVDQSVTMSMGGFVGTPHFASPEQLEEKEIDIRSDIYSLGATLWFMLAGRPPFLGSMASVINQHLSQQPPSDVLVKLHPRIAALLEKMLAKRPEDRFQSPADLKRELDEILSDLKGQSPTLAPIRTPAAGANQPSGAATVGGTSTSGFATGQLIRSRYQILGQSPFDKNLFKAKDLHSNGVVALRPLPLAIRYETARLDFLRQEVERLRTIHHPNLLEVLGLEAYDRGLFIVSEWIKGFSLQELLRVRRELAWEETLRITKPLAKVLDFAADRKLLAGRVSLQKIFVEIPHLSEEAAEFQRTPVSNWPPFIVKVDALSLGQTLPEFLAEPTQTIVDTSGFNFPANHVQQLGLVIYELLGGVKPASSTASAAPRLNPVSNLSEPGNAILRLGTTEPTRFATAGDFLAGLEAAEVQNQAPLTPPMAIPQPTGGDQASFPRSIPAAQPGGEPIEDSQPKTSPVLLRMLLTGVGLFLVCAIGAVIGANFFIHKPESAPVVPQTGSVTVTSKPEGATVKWNGQAIGKTPIASYPLPKGKYILELSLAGYQTRPIEVEINPGSLNNLGLVPLVHDVGQLSIKSDPGALAFQIVDSEQKTTFGNTPMTVDNLPTGKYTVRIKRSGWPDYVQEIDLQPNALVVVEHNFKGVSVTLKSDPAGATIFMGDSELGKTPLTVELPPEPVELVSRIGALKPVKREIVPDPNGTSVIDFKHEYGLISLASDRADSEVSIGGVNLGKLPIEGILPPGQHQVVVRAPGAPDQTRVADIKVGERSVMQVNFNSVGSTAAALAPKQVEPERSAAQSTPAQSRARTPRPQEKPTYRTKDEYDHAKDAAYDRFDADWEARKNALKREKDYYDYQADHSEGATKEKWKTKKDEADRRLDQLDDQKDAAKQALKRQWND
ncbi:MAG: protein kinase [Verrucomicrobia bacterium]|nr:protein kinase [Verrucomicrobiota bacterium]